MDKNRSAEYESIIRDYKEIFSTEQGKRVLLDLHAFCGVATTGFNVDSHIMSYRCGLRAVYQVIQQRVDIPEKALWDMIGTDEAVEDVYNELN